MDGTAYCPAGKMAISGGWEVWADYPSGMEDVMIMATNPTSDGTGWSVSLRDPGPAGEQGIVDIEVVAVCATVQ
jgi:hypothetical protein